MKKLLFFAFLAGAMFAGCTTEEPVLYGGIYGTIRDAKTGSPIYNAEISLTPGQRTTVSGFDGTYNFQNLDAMQYSLNVIASGYTYNSRKVSVVPGESTVCDMLLTPEEDVEGMRLSATVLDFDTIYSSLSFTIYNTGTTPLSYYITGITAGWVTITPMDGTIAVGQSSSVTVEIKRSLITEDVMSSFTVNAAGGSKSVMIKIKKGENTGGGGSDDDDDNTGGGSGSGGNNTGGGSAQNVTNGLFAYYLFEDNCNNSVDGAPNGQGINSPTYVDGMRGTKALKLSVVDNSYLNVPRAMIDGGTFTVSFWIKGLSDGHLFHIETSNTEDNIFGMKDGQLYLVRSYTFHYEYNNFTTFAHPTIDSEKWTMIAVSWQYSNGQAKLYIDGEYIDIISASLEHNSNGLKFVFGGELDNITPPSMAIDNLRVYNSRALSEDEVKLIYNYEK